MVDPHRLPASRACAVDLSSCNGRCSLGHSQLASRLGKMSISALLPVERSSKQTYPGIRSLGASRVC